MQVAEPHVWAAQFRLLDARFIKLGSGGIENVKLPVTMGLYRDVISVNTARGPDGRSIELGLDLDNQVAESQPDDQDSEELAEYEKRLEQAIGIFEKAPKHFLQ